MATDGPDTDFTAKLIDVHPASPDYPRGYAMLLTDGIARLRYAEDPAAPRLRQPGEVVRLRVTFLATANLFLPGHRIRLDVSSSNFPKFDVNPNTGEPEGQARRRRDRGEHRIRRRRPAEPRAAANSAQVVGARSGLRAICVHGHGRRNESPRSSMSNRPQPLTAEAWALIVALSVPWGLSFFFYRFLVNDFPPFTLVFGRLSISAVALYALVRLSGRRMDIPWLGFFVMGTLNNAIPFTLIAWGETRITSGLAAILNATTPIFAALVLHAFRAERLTPARVAGVILGFVGVAILVGPDAWGLTRDLPAEAACLLACVSYAFTALWSRRLRHVEPLLAAAGQVVCSSLILAPSRCWRSTSHGTLPMPGIAAWLGLCRCGADLHGARLHPVLSHPGGGGRRQPDAGDVPDPDFHDAAGRRLSA